MKNIKLKIAYNRLYYFTTPAITFNSIIYKDYQLIYESELNIFIWQFTILLFIFPKKSPHYKL